MKSEKIMKNEEKFLTFEKGILTPVVEQKEDRFS